MASTSVTAEAGIPHSLTGLTGLMLQSGKYSDLTIKCQGRVFKVHRNVVCLQSKPLAAAVDNFKEGVTGEIDLDDQEPGVVESMIQFLYTRDYSATVDASGGTLMANVKVYIIADRYDILDLKLAATKKYQAAEPKEWNTASFSAILQLLYDHTPVSDGLREVIAQAAAKHAKELVGRGEFALLCQENGEVAFDILQANLALTQKSDNCSCGLPRPANISASSYSHNRGWGNHNNVQWYCSCGRYNNWS